ncbi:hypothetical protein HAV15_006723 [Penicillium sp. str. |nr:hypothetical protein HAV15_006723 [Penicillium sp. str. \
MPSKVRVTLTVIEIPTSSTDGAGQCNKGRVTGRVFHPGTSKFPARVQFPKRDAPQRGSEGWKQGQRDTDTVDVPIVLSPAGVSQKQLQKAICALQQQKGTEDAKKLGQSAIADTRATVGEPGSYEAIAAVFGV